MQGLEPIPTSMGKRRSTSWTSHQFIVGLTVTSGNPHMGEHANSTQKGPDSANHRTKMPPQAEQSTATLRQNKTDPKIEP